MSSSVPINDQSEKAKKVKALSIYVNSGLASGTFVSSTVGGNAFMEIRCYSNSSWPCHKHDLFLRRLLQPEA